MRRAAGDLQGSIAAHEESLAIARRVRAGGQEIGSLTGLGETLLAAGDTTQAIGLCGEAVRLARQAIRSPAKGWLCET